MKKLLISLFVLSISSCYAQAPTAGDLVAIHSATLAKINAIVDPHEGSLIYNSDDSFLYQFTGASWQKLTPEGNTLIKTATAGWNAQGYSLAHAISATTGGHLDWIADQSNKYVMIGLSTTPSTSASYTNLGYAMYMVTNSNIQIRENGASLGYVSGYSAGDKLTINIDCLGNVTYLKNDIVIFSSSKKATNPLYFDSSFHGVDASISNITMTY